MAINVLDEKEQTRKLQTHRPHHTRATHPDETQHSLPSPPVLVLQYTRSIYNTFSVPYLPRRGEDQLNFL